MGFAPRVFVSVPMDAHLDPLQTALKHAILDAIRDSGFEPQEFLVSGLALRKPYNFANTHDVMDRCHGAVILALARWSTGTEGKPAALPTVWNHYEGALALALQKETLVITEKHVAVDGITWDGGGQIILRAPATADAQWTKTKDFQAQFQAWADAVRKRRHVFVGYCSKGRGTANDVIKYLTSIGVGVRDWETDFHAGGTILDEIREAARSTRGGIFLLTRDDELVSGDAHYDAPRDNVVFEAGYFMQAKGRDRVLMIREEGARMPADVGGSIYLLLKDRQDIAPTPNFVILSRTSCSADWDGQVGRLRLCWGDTRGLTSRLTR